MLWKKVAAQVFLGRPRPVGRDPARRYGSERMRFVAARYWDVLCTDPGRLRGATASVGGRRIAQGRDFGPDGKAREEVVVLDEGGAPAATQLDGPPVRSASGRRFAVHPPPDSPFRTSTLQQEASRKLRFSSQTTMLSPRGCTRTATSPTCPTR